MRGRDNGERSEPGSGLNQTVGPAINRAYPFAGLNAEETRMLRRLLKRTKYYKKKPEEKDELLVKLLALVKSNSERVAEEESFAHNANVASRRRFRASLRAHRWLIVMLVTSVFVLSAAAYLINGYLLLVGEIEVEGNERYEAGDIIDVSGIKIGQRLFWGGVSAADVKSAILSSFSYIGSVDIEKSIPNRIVITVTEEEAVFYSELYGQYVLLTTQLRILELCGSLPEGSYIKLILPAVRSVIKGEQLEFTGDDDMLGVAVKAAAAASADELRAEVGVLDISDRFNIRISYGGKYRIELGDISDVEIKLRLAQRIMQDGVFAGGSKGTIYVSDVSKPSVIIDNEVNLD